MIVMLIYENHTHKTPTIIVRSSYKIVYLAW